MWERPLLDLYLLYKDCLGQVFYKGNPEFSGLNLSDIYIVGILVLKLIIF